MTSKQSCPDCGATVSQHNMVYHRGSLACKRMAHETRKTTPVPMKDGHLGGGEFDKFTRSK